jgi:hypothetical protein
MRVATFDDRSRLAAFAISCGRERRGERQPVRPEIDTRLCRHSDTSQGCRRSGHCSRETRSSSRGSMARPFRSSGNCALGNGCLETNGRRSWYLASLVARIPRFKRWINEHETARRKVFDRECLRSPRGRYRSAPSSSARRHRPAPR